MSHTFEYVELKMFYQLLSFLFLVNVDTVPINLGVSDGDESVGRSSDAASSFSVRIILPYTSFNLTTNPDSPSSPFFFFARSKMDV